MSKIHLKSTVSNKKAMLAGFIHSVFIAFYLGYIFLTVGERFTDRYFNF